MTQSIQRSMTAGEIAPALRSRADLAKYTTGLATCENFFIRAQGGAYSRAGFSFRGEISDSTTRARLIKFVFSNDQTYQLVFENLQLQIIQNGNYLETAPGVRYTVVTPYTSTDVARLQVTQSADVMTIVHPNYRTRSLSRYAQFDWRLTVDNYAPSLAAVGTLTLAAVGASPGAASKAYEYVVSAVDANGVESLPSPVNSISMPSALALTYGVRITWAAVAGAVKYRVYKDPSVGTGVFGWIGDTVTLAFEDYNLAPITSDAPQSDNQPFDTADVAGDNPSTVSYYQQRRMFGNTFNSPQTVYASQTAEYLSLRSSSPTRDADAIEFTVAGEEVNEIRHIVDVDGLLLLTAGAAMRVTEGPGQVLTPASVGVRKSTQHGASWVPPARIGSSAVYVQAKGGRVRDIHFDGNLFKYISEDLSVMSEHMFESNTIVEMAYSEEPYSILWMVRDDGQLLGLTYLREHKVFAWHRHITSGTFESVSVISENGHDAVYVIVNRTIGAVTKRYVERLESRLFATAADSFCVDSGITYSGAPATVIINLDHLEGEAVTVLADGNEVTGLTVVGGQITLPTAASLVHIGLSYLPRLDTLDVDIISEKNTLKGREVSVSRVFIEVEKSRGGWVGPIADPVLAGDTTEVDMLEIKPRFGSDAYDTIALKTFKQEITLTPDWNMGGGIRIEQRAPLPLTVLSIIPDITEGG